MGGLLLTCNQADGLCIKSSVSPRIVTVVTPRCLRPRKTIWYDISRFCKSGMLRFTNAESRGHRAWCALVVLLAVSALTVSVATRYCAPQSSFSYAVKTVHKHSSPEQIRQRLTKNAVNWMPQVGQTGILQAPTSYPRIAPAGPPIPGLLLETSLYNRPPPSC